MPAEPLHSECPHCRAKLQVDRISGMVVSFEEPPDSLDKAQEEAQEGQPRRRRDAFESALKAECNREKDLDDLFRKAADKQKGKDDSTKADNPLDDRWR